VSDEDPLIAERHERSVTLCSHVDSAKELNEARGYAKLIRVVKLLLGEIEADTASDRQLAAKAHLAENAFFHGGQRPFGFQPGPRITLSNGRMGTVLVAHPIEFPVCVDAVRMAAFEGRSTADIGEYWRDADGIVVADGEPVYQGKVHRTLTSPRLRATGCVTCRRRGAGT
jgi:site-specific DNA recombinase